MNAKLLPVDRNGNPIQAGSVINVCAVDITSAAYTAVAVPAGLGCKAFIAKSRAGNTWYCADSAAPTAYMTLDTPLACNCVGFEGQVLFYAKGSAADTLEILLLN
jgi:hypothetical protein